MDFSLDDDLVALQGLSREILADLATTERVRDVETTPTAVDDELWRALGDAGLLGLTVPEGHGGAGLGRAALAVLLEEQGRTVAPVPVWPHAVAALALGERGDLLPGMADGTVRVTLALEEYGAADPAAPATTATPDPAAPGGWRLSGIKAVVPSPQGAAYVLVSATAPDGAGVFLVDAGVGWALMPVTTHDVAGELTLVDAPAERIGDAGTLAVLLRDARIALAALHLGVAEGALALAASYLSQREQFGRPLGSFQAVQHQLADCWIDIDAMRVVLWQAVSDADEAGTGASPAAERSALVTAWWRSQAGLDVVHRVQHVHGGIGVDVDYPVHRFFLWGKQLAGTLGGSAAALADLGDHLAVVAG